MVLFLKYFIGYLIISGLAKSIIVTCFYVFGVHKKGENHVQIMSNVGGFFDLSLILFAFFCSLRVPYPSSVSFGDLLNINSEFIYYTDRMSLIYLLFSFLVIGLVGRFSCFYLHKDRYYYKFFSLFYIFQTASVLLILSDNFASYFIGWELLGISSVLLISFYSDRVEPIKNSLRVFSLYKVSDVLLFSGFAVAYSHTHLQLFSEFSKMNGSVVSVYILLTSLAIMIKMGGFPLIWLPRAMEGPTPSSAVFYGALATHIPLLLFIKLWSGVTVSTWVLTTLIFVFSIIIFISTVFSRMQSDAKNILAYATVKHLSIISIEVLFGFIYLAYLHTLIHCFSRLFQYIRTPSLLYEYHQSEGYNGAHFPDGGKFYEKCFPFILRNGLYRLVLKEFYIFPRVYRLIDVLIGITNNLSKKKVSYIVIFNSIIFLGLLALEWNEFQKVHFSFFLLGPPWVFSLFALLINYRNWRYVLLILLSIVSLATVIFYVDDLFSLTDVFIIQLSLFLVLGLGFATKYFSQPQIYISGRYKVVLFMISLWMVGVPGPGTYYMFEKAIHLSMEQDMYLSIGAFVILSINTLGVVKYYSLDCLRSKGKII